LQLINISYPSAEGKLIMKRGFKQLRNGVHPSGTGHRPAVGFCEHGNKLQGAKKAGEFLDQTDHAATLLIILTVSVSTHSL
jgi:hypothetical protein